jgi:HPt (histidine-containing phosphotransfer) domain-containing protein
MTSETSYVDLSYLEEFTGGDKQKLHRYLAMYLKTAPPAISEFQILLQQQNFEDLKLKAHSIKPQAHYLGISALKDVLAEMEAIIRDNGDVNRLPLLVTEAERIGLAAEKEINSLLLI